MVITVEAHKIAYMAVPKAACSSIKFALAEIDPEMAGIKHGGLEDMLFAHTRYQTQRFRPHRWAQYSDWWRFTVVRDPLQRLFSAYSDFVVKRKLLYKSPKLRRTDLPKEPDPDFFFQNVEQYKELSSVIRHHILPVRLFAGPKLEGYDRIYKMEELDQLAQDITARTGKSFVIPRANKSGKTFEFTDLHPKTQDHLRVFLAEEYDYFKGYYDNPMG